MYIQIIKTRDDTQRSGKDPRQVVILSQRIRTELGDLKKEFTALAKILKDESSKKKVQIDSGST